MCGGGRGHRQSACECHSSAGRLCPAASSAAECPLNTHQPPLPASQKRRSSRFVVALCVGGRGKAQNSVARVAVAYIQLHCRHLRALLGRGRMHQRRKSGRQNTNTRAMRQEAVRQASETAMPPAPPPQQINV